jgi:hypothetical protein
MLPAAVKLDLVRNLERVHRQHVADLHIRTVQELLGRWDVATMMIYTHVLNRGPTAASSLSSTWTRCFSRFCLSVLRYATFGFSDAANLDEGACGRSPSS